MVGARPRLWRLQRPLRWRWLLELLLLLMLLRVLLRRHHGATERRPQGLLLCVRCPLLLMLLRLLLLGVLCRLLLLLRLLCVSGCLLLHLVVVRRHWWCDARLQCTPLSVLAGATTAVRKTKKERCRTLQTEFDRLIVEVSMSAPLGAGAAERAEGAAAGSAAASPAAAPEAATAVAGSPAVVPAAHHQQPTWWPWHLAYTLAQQIHTASPLATTRHSLD